MESLSRGIHENLHSDLEILNNLSPDEIEKMIDYILIFIIEPSQSQDFRSNLGSLASNIK